MRDEVKECEYCGSNYPNHYHCANCGEFTSMMGHWNGKSHTCTRPNGFHGLEHMKERRQAFQLLYDNKMQIPQEYTDLLAQAKEKEKQQAKTRECHALRDLQLVFGVRGIETIYHYEGRDYRIKLEEIPE